MDYLFPMALEFGMTSKEFWQDDPNLFSSYRTFYINKIKSQGETDNNNAWLFGLYNYNSLNVSLSNMWAKKGNDLKSYLEKPIDFNKKENDKKTQIDLEAKIRANLRYYATRDNLIPKDQ